MPRLVDRPMQRWVCRVTMEAVRTGGYGLHDLKGDTMSRSLLCGVVMVTLLLLAGCSASLPSGDSGSVTLIPFFNGDSGISGVVPVTCRQAVPGNFECPDLAPDGSMAVIVQQAYPGARDELVGEVLAQTSLAFLPEPAGSFRGRAFDWDLYSLEAQINEAGPDTMRLELALAEDGSLCYLVALVTLPESYDAHPDLFDTIFTHAVYGLVPWE